MVKHTQTIRRQKSKNCLTVTDHFVGLALKGKKIMKLKKGNEVAVFLQETVLS